ncbi:FAD binding domain-containing protein [Lasiosphaeris hirsuta]|uniref:FAD binding domain-containing protein n=1 Tax=Lasiosphaeris hirsuta TaxID=260670 RepID=A0AA40DLM5_9PEZI|nr:FAD binding domain-containing protein [Lasiosphaeris hirsuta]
MAEHEQVDVLICGSGSAGLCAAVWLSRFGISYRVLERRDGPLAMGQADGVQTRTVEIFDSFGLGEDLLRDAYHVLELAFWSPAEDAPESGIRRKRYAPDKETELSHQPHVILNQAKMNALLIRDIGKDGTPAPIEYGCLVTGIEIDEAQAGNPDAHCVTARAVQAGVEKTYKAKYLLGCDGAHSVIRKSLGFKMIGDSSDAVWGVMDIYPLTTFPDIRKKAVINAASGNILIIPREGDAMVRLYIELPAGTAVGSVTLADLQDRARLAFAPYPLAVAETAWWSAYAIGQRHADFFHAHHRAFLTGDACHTHSPKAGQGMNVSLQDGHNIGWKLGMVLRGRAAPALLATYVAEREKTAIELIEFDRGFTRLFNSQYRADHGITPAMFAERFVQAGRYTAGQATHYSVPSAITVPGERDAELVAKVIVGMRFPSAQVVRFCDAKAMQLVRALPADGQWFVVVFAGDLASPPAAARLAALAAALDAVAKAFTPKGEDPDRIVDRVLVLAGERKRVEHEEIPEFFTPVTGKWGIKALTKVFSDDESYNSGHGHAYEAYGVSPEQGAVVIVRPDHYVAKVTTLEDDEGIHDFFKGFLVPVQ